MVGGVVAIVEHPWAVTLTVSGVVDPWSDEVMTQAELAERQVEGVQLAAVLWDVCFEFVVGDVREDGRRGGGRGRQRGGESIFQLVQRRIFGLRGGFLFGATAAASRRVPPPPDPPHEVFPFSPEQVPHPLLHLPIFFQIKKKRWDFQLWLAAPAPSTPKRGPPPRGAGVLVVRLCAPILGSEGEVSLLPLILFL